MGLIKILLVLMIATAVGCVSRMVNEASPIRPLRSIDGLDRVSIPMPGQLDLREDHRIGSYDAFLIPEASLSYKRGSLRLTPPAEKAFLSLLRQSIVVASQAADIPIMEKPGACVMEIKLTVIDLDLDLANDRQDLAELTLVMQFRDSLSRQSLLRYAAGHRIPKPGEEMTADRQLRAGLDRVIAEMNIAGPVRTTGFADDTILPGCKGTLAERGRAAAAARQ